MPEISTGCLLSAMFVDVIRASIHDRDKDIAGLAGWQGQSLAMMKGDHGNLSRLSGQEPGTKIPEREMTVWVAGEECIL